MNAYCYTRELAGLFFLMRTEGPVTIRKQLYPSDEDKAIAR